MFVKVFKFTGTIDSVESPKEVNVLCQAGLSGLLYFGVSY